MQAERFRTKGATVKLQRANFAGARWHHLVVDRADGSMQDMFILNRGNTNYCLLISQGKRDPAVVSKVTKGFRFVGK